MRVFLLMLFLASGIAIASAEEPGQRQSRLMGAVLILTAAEKCPLQIDDQLVWDWATQGQDLSTEEMGFIMLMGMAADEQTTLTESECDRWRQRAATDGFLLD